MDHDIESQHQRGETPLPDTLVEADNKSTDAAPTFTASWTPSKAAAFDVAALPLKKTRKAWERRPSQAIVENGKVRTVWKRYPLRSQPPNAPAQVEVRQEDEDVQDFKTPRKVVKKLRVGSPVKRDASSHGKVSRKVSAQATRFERRKSSVKRKRAARVREEIVEEPVAGSWETLELNGRSKHSVGETADATFVSTVAATSGCSRRIDHDEADWEDALDAKPSQEVLRSAEKTCVSATAFLRGSGGETVPEAQDILLPIIGEALMTGETGREELPKDIGDQPDQLDHYASPMQEDNDQAPMAEAAQDQVEEVLIVLESNPADLAVVPIQLSDCPMDQVETGSWQTSRLDAGDAVDGSLLGIVAKVEAQIAAPEEQTEKLDDIPSTQEAGLSNTYSDQEIGHSHPALDADAAAEEEEEEEEEEDSILGERGQVQPEPTKSLSAPRNRPIDIFGFDEEEEAEPMCTSGDHNEEAKPDDDTESDDEEEPSFKISLNDETVNLGALLASNDNLSATITGSVIELEIFEDSNDNQDQNSPRSPCTDELRGNDQEAPGSPDELSMDADTTSTLTFTTSGVSTHLEDDKAVLSSFMRKVAANRAAKAASANRRESLRSRRDSDIVRKALANSRQALEDKDVNASPQRASQPNDKSAHDSFQSLTSPPVKAGDTQLQIPKTDLGLDQDGGVDELSTPVDLESGSPRRRSSRSKNRSPPSSASSLGPNKIPVRTDGSERILLNRTEAQLLAGLVRKNTLKNKGTSIPAPQRLAKLRLEATLAVPDDDSQEVIDKLVREGKKAVTWRAELTEYSASMATADWSDTKPTVSHEQEIIIPVSASLKKTGTPQMRRLRGLGTSNGTPAKKVLQETLMLDEIEEQKTIELAVKQESQRRSKIATPIALTTVPVEAETCAIGDTGKEAKSKLPTTKKLSLNPSVASLSGLPVLLGKENTTVGLFSPARKPMTKIPAPSSSLPSSTPGVLGLGSAIPVPSSLLSAATTVNDISTGLRIPVRKVRLGARKGT